MPRAMGPPRPRKVVVKAAPKVAAIAVAMPPAGAMPLARRPARKPKAAKPGRAAKVASAGPRTVPRGKAGKAVGAATGAVAVAPVEKEVYPAVPRPQQAREGRQPVCCSII